MTKRKNYGKEPVVRIARILKLSLLFLCLGVASGYASGGINEGDLTVKGRVTETTGDPLIGVSIHVKGALISAITNAGGEYEISVPDKSSVLQFRYIGFVTVEETVGNRTLINVQLREDENLLDEVVIVGYDTQRKVNLTGAVANINVSQQLEGRPITDVGRGLQGATPGLTITTSSGRLGTTPTIRIRGQQGTLLNDDNGASKPLILVDGVEISDLNMINPDDIENISVLKDAASSSIYGSRAAFGVVLITTKSGKNSSRFSASYSNNISWTTPTTLPSPAKSYESAAMALAAWQRQTPGDMEFGGDAGMKWDADAIERMKEWERNFGGMNLGPELVAGRDFEMTDKGLRFYRSWDAFDMYIQDGFAQQHNLSVSGKSGATSYHLGIGYMGDRGILKANPDHYNRYSTTFKTETEVTKWLSVRSQLLFSRTSLESPFTYSSTTYDPLYYIYRWPTIYPYGTYNGVPFRSALAETEQANTNSDTKNYTRITLGGTITFTKELSLDADYSYIMDNRLRQLRGGTVTAIDFWSGNVNNVSTYTASSYDKYDQFNYLTDHHTANAVLRYKKELGKDHKVSAFAGWNLEYETYNTLNGEARDLMDPDKHTVSMTTGDQFVYGAQSDWASVGFFGRINYAFKDRYLLELNGRYDGSSYFPLNQPWGFFPSASLGWILSEESFLQSTQSWLSFAKIRASIGSVGNPNIGADRFRAIMARTATSGWVINSTNEATFALPTALAKGFTWENIETRDLGLDLRFLNGKLGATFDVYQRINDGMVVSGVQMPSTFGATAPYMNVGELTTKGWELALDFNHSFSDDFKLRLNFNLSDALTKISKHPNLTKTLDGTNYAGKIIGEIWGFETDRFFTEDDFNSDGTLKAGIPDQSRYLNYLSTNGMSRFLPGDIKYKDLDGSGVIDRGEFTADNHGDLKKIGNSTPRYEYSGRIGLDYKGFDLDVFIQGVGSRQIWGTGNLIIPGFQFGDGLYYAHQTDYWTPDNPGAFYPRLTKMNQPGRYVESGGNFMPQTKYLLNMAYCRLKNVTFGYSLPKSVLQKASIGKTRLYVSLENLFELDHLGNIPIDPETNTSTGDGGTQGFGRIYPYVRTLSFGIQVSL
ncbi:MAG: TonB-dependent receptor [Dysgonamonadaceae bacterium]|jgi:TonB-linked SusC/RagA family outer membrane protein|nr:TonB-dependent receptor [Dysgonamonadaceae bacterium]